LIKRLKHLTHTAKTHQGFRRYFANTSWMFAEQMLRMVAGLLVGVWVARYLGPEQFGVFSYSVAFVALFTTIGKLGLDGIVVRDLVNDPQKRDDYLGTAFWLKFIGALIAFGSIYGSSFFITNEYNTRIYLLIIASGMIFQSFDVIDFYFQSKVLSRFVSLSKFIQLLLSSAFKVYFILMGADLIYFVIVSVVDQFSLAIALAYSYSKQKITSFYFNFDKKIAREMLLNSKPLIISGIMVSIYTCADRIIIRELLGVREVGIYTVATTLTMSLYFIPMLIANSLFPAILNSKNQSNVLYKERLSKLYKYLLSFGLCVCLSVYIFAFFIINLLYGAQYQESVEVLQIYIWVFLTICYSSVFGKWLLAENLQFLLPRFTLAAVLVNITGCFVFIPLWSIKGAAFAALISQVFPLVFFGIINKHLRGQLKAVFSNARRRNY